MEWKQSCTFLFRLIIDVLFPLSHDIERFKSLTAEALLSTAKKCSHDMVLEHVNGEAVFVYRDPLVRDAIRAFKYEKLQKLGVVFAEVLFDAFHEDIAYDMLLSVSGPLIFIPIPLSQKRLHERGFNQSSLVAKHFAQLFENERIMYAEGLLVRSKHTEKQALRPGRAERKENIRGCFSTPFPEKIIGKHIILIDDVITTGATMSEAHQTLLNAGAITVRCIAIAH